MTHAENTSQYHTECPAQFQPRLAQNRRLPSFVTTAQQIAIVIPAMPALAGLQCWWQAVGIVPSSPFLLLTDGAVRTISGPRRF